MKHFFFYVVMIVVMMACTKESSNEFFPYPNDPLNDTTWVANATATSPAYQLLETLRTPTKTDSFNINTGGTLRFSDGFELTIPAHSMETNNGAVVTGNIRIEVKHLNKKGELIRFAKPSNAYGTLLESAGTFLIRASKEQQELNLLTNKQIQIRFTDPSPSTVMKVFYGEQNLQVPLPQGTNPLFTWKLGIDSSNVRTFSRYDSVSNSTIKGYEVNSKRLKWINCARPLEQVANVTKVTTLLPLNFTNANTNVFIVFKDKKVVSMLNGELSSKTFTTFNIPVGTRVTFVSLSKIGNQTYVGVKESTITANHTEQLTPTVKTIAQIQSFLNGL